jgi:hypothetical protein
MHHFNATPKGTFVHAFALMLDHIPRKTFHDLVWLMLRGCGSTVSNSQNILWSSLIIPSVCSNKLIRQTIKTGTPQIINTLRNCATVTQQLIWGLRFRQWWRFDLWSSGLWCHVALSSFKMEVVHSSTVMVTTYKTIQDHSLEDQNWLICCL